MLKKLDTKKKIILALGFMGATILLFAIAVFGVLGKEFDSHILLNYFFVGLAVGLYVFVIVHFDLFFAFILFISGYIIAFVSMFYSFSKASNGFSDLAGIILWLINMVLVVALGITVEILLKRRHKEKHGKYEVIDAEIIEPETDNSDHSEEV